MIILVLATTNEGKIAEIEFMLKDYPVSLKNLKDFGPIPKIHEDGKTFEENAYKKSSITAKILGLPALSDDSGLMVDALDGAPGVHSARFGGEDLNDKKRYELLLQSMEGKENRKAAFECVISIAMPTGPALTYESRCEGLITHKPAGTYGFGYDPIFYYPPLNKTFGQLSEDEKSQVSHRGKALKEVGEEFDKEIKWINQHKAMESANEDWGKRHD